MEKNTCNLEVQSSVFFGESFLDSGPGGSISSDPERRALRRRGEELGYTEVLQQRTGSLNIKR